MGVKPSQHVIAFDRVFKGVPYRGPSVIWFVSQRNFALASGLRHDALKNLSQIATFVHQLGLIFNF